MPEPDPTSEYRPPFWARRPVLWAITASLATLLLLFGLAHLYAERNRTQAREEIASALRAGQYSRAARLLEIPLAEDPEDRDLRELHARLLTHTQTAGALPLWSEFWEEQPRNPEFGVALVLCQIRLGRMEAARETLAAWPEDLRHAPAYHRASLAYAFASGRSEEALQHAGEIARQHPESLADRLNLAKLEIDDAAAESALWALTDDPATRPEALRSLAQRYLRSPDRAPLRQVLERARQGWADQHPSTLLWALEAEFAAGWPSPAAEVRRAWEQVRGDASGGRWFHLLAWMNRAGWSEEIWSWLGDPAEPRHWAFPGGFSLVEAALLTGREETARQALLARDWPGQRALHALCLAKLCGSSTLGTLWLRRAAEAAATPDSRTRLRGVVQAWGWLDGEVHLTLAALARGDRLDPAGLAPLLTELERRGRTADLADLSRALLSTRPEHPVLLNNAAYYGALRRDRQALAWARQAQAAAPGQPAYAATLALALAVENRWEEAAAALAEVPDPGLGLLPRLLLLQHRGEPVPEELRARAALLHMPEERELAAPALRAE